jgi:PilZ domain
MAKERRQAPRVKVNLKARWEGDHGQQEANVTSLSTNGCFVLTGGVFKPKELVRLEILFPDDDPIYLWAEVVEAAEEIGFALRFTSLEAEDEARLGQFLQRCLTAQSK